MGDSGSTWQVERHWAVPYNGTSHVTNQNGAGFSFTFQGEYVLVRGPNDFQTPNGTNTTVSSTWTCQVDGATIPIHPYWSNPEAGRSLGVENVLCETGGLALNSPHTVNVTALIDDSSTQTFPVDCVEYAPALSASVLELEDVDEEQVLRIDASDLSSIQYANSTGAWVAQDMGYGTAQDSASLSFKFNGTSAVLVGFTNLSQWVGLEYRIDNSTHYADMHLVSEVLSSGNQTYDNIQLWNIGRNVSSLRLITPPLEHGLHEVIVSFNHSVTNISETSDPVQAAGAPFIIRPWVVIDHLYVTTPLTNQLSSLPQRVEVPRTNTELVKFTAENVAELVGGLLGIPFLALIVKVLLLLCRDEEEEEEEDWKKDVEAGEKPAPWTLTSARAVGNDNTDSGTRSPELRSENANDTTQDQDRTVA